MLAHKTDAGLLQLMDVIISAVRYPALFLICSGPVLAVLWSMQRALSRMYSQAQCSACTIRHATLLAVLAPLH